MTKNKSLVEAIKADFHKATIGEKDTAMLEYVEKLTRAPWEVGEENIDKLKRAGFRDADILDIVLVAAYFAFVNRLASGLGVELEEYWNK